MSTGPHSPASPPGYSIAGRKRSWGGVGKVPYLFRADGALRGWATGIALRTVENPRRSAMAAHQFQHQPTTPQRRLAGCDAATWKDADTFRYGKLPPMHFGVRRRKLRPLATVARADPFNAGELTPPDAQALDVKPRQERVLSSRISARPASLFHRAAA